jgi:four helix bundle protein
MRDHRKLEVFTLADRLTFQIYEATRKFPVDERYGLSSQLRRAAVSIGANIVEGAARPSDIDYRRLLTIAYGSACELEYELSIAIRLGYVQQEFRRDLAEQASRTCRSLRRLIQTIRG